MVPDGASLDGAFIAIATVRLSDLPFPLPLPLVQSWLYVPDEPIGDPASLSAKIVGYTGR